MAQKGYHNILKSRIITEKGEGLQKGGVQKEVFKVDPRANKFEIKKAYEALFGVKVESVTTTSVKSKVKRNKFGFGVKSGGKKAYILPKKSD